MRPIVAVVGATGLQGGATVDALLQHEKFTVRAVVRDPDSVAARKLTDRGIELRRADLNDVTSLVQAFEGCHGVFINTDTRSNRGSLESELQQGKNASDAAQKAGVQHAVWSTLEDPAPGISKDMPSMNGLTIPIFQTKQAIEDYIRRHGPPTTYLLTSSYYENYFGWFRYQRQSDGTFLLRTNNSTKPFAQNAVQDIGLSAAAIFEAGEAMVGRTVSVVSQTLGMDEAMAAISEVTGSTVKYSFATDLDVRSLPFILAVPAANMYQYFRQTSHYEDIRAPSTRVVKGLPFREWAEAHKDQLRERLQQATPVGELYLPYG